MVRKAKTEDFKSLTNLFTIENKHNSSIAPDAVCSTQDVLTEAELDKILSDSSQYLCVSEFDNDVVGLLLGNIINIEGRRWTKARCYGYIEELVVSNEVRGKGIARSLVEHFESRATNKGATTLELHVWSNNSLANEFYSKVGFTEKQLLLSKPV